MGRILIRDTMFMTFMDDGYTALQINNKDILIENGQISRIAYHIDDSDCIVIDGRGKLTLPGLVNARSRAFASKISKGIAEDVNCDAYGNSPLYHRVNPMINLALDQLDDEEITAILALAVYEAINSGTTTLIDQGTGRDTELLLKLCKKMNLRVFAAPMLSNAMRLPEGNKTGQITFERKDTADLEWNRKLIEMYGDGIARAAVGIAGCDLADDDLIREASKLAKEKRVPLLMPFCETRYEVEQTKRIYGKTASERLRDCGALTAQTILGGAVYAGDEDLDSIKGTGVHIAHCPEEAAQDGVMARMVAPLSRHINTGIGTGRCSVNLLEALRICALIGKIEFKRRYKVRGMYVYYAATEAGTQMLGLPLGRIEEGQIADLITIRVDQPHHIPFQLPLTDLLYAAHTGDVSDVIINGQVVKHEGIVQSPDYSELFKKAREALKHLWSCALEKGTY